MLTKWTTNGPTCFDTAENYVGKTFPGFLVAPVSQTRDSECLERVNFDAVTADILKASTHEETAIRRFGHWGPGWYELLLIHPDDAPAIACAEEWQRALEDYPVADEEAFSRAEWDEVMELWEHSSVRDRLSYIQDANRNSPARVSPFAARRDTFPDDPAGRVYERLTWR